MTDLKDVHTEHCCSKHGCKYGYLEHPSAVLDRCTVLSGRAPQSFPCERCGYEREEVATWLPEATDEELAAEIDRRQLGWGPPPMA